MSAVGRKWVTIGDPNRSDAFRVERATGDIDSAVATCVVEVVRLSWTAIRKQATLNMVYPLSNALTECTDAKKIQAIAQILGFNLRLPDPPSDLPPELLSEKP